MDYENVDKLHVRVRERDRYLGLKKETKIFRKNNKMGGTIKLNSIRVIRRYHNE